LGGTPDVADIIPITDVSDTTGSVNGTTKKVTVANLVAAAPQGDLVASNNLSDVASAGTARTNLGLGTAATQDVGTSASNVVQLDGTAKLPAVDGSQLTNLSSSVSKSIVTPTFTGTPPTYSLTSSENGKVVIVNESTNAIVTVPQNLGSGFNCRLVQTNSGKILVEAGSGASVSANESKTASNGISSVIELLPTATDNYIVAGDRSSPPFVNNYSASFDGVDDHLYFGSSSGSSASDVLLGTTDFAISLWLNHADTSEDVVFMDSTANDYMHVVGNTFKLTGYGSNVSVSSSGLIVGSWNHVVITRTSGTETIYVNNSQINTRSESGAFRIATFGYYALAGYFLNGKLDEISFHSQGLSSSDVSALYNSGNGPIDLSSGYNLSGWWSMGDSASASIALDRSGGGNNLNMFGGSLTDSSIP